MKIKKRIFQFFVYMLKPIVAEILNRNIRVWGSRDRLKISPKAKLVNTLLDTVSGFIEIGEYTFTGHNVSIITGTHNYEVFLQERMGGSPSSGNDITIGKGVWIGSSSTILGPCTIGDHSVVATGAVIVPGTEIPAYTIFAGVPAKLIKRMEQAMPGV